MSLIVKQLTVGQLQSNCFLLIDDENDVGIVVDPGDDADFIIRKILDEQIKIEAILATHGHFDHVLAVNELKMAFKAPFLMHGKDDFLLDRMRETTRHFVGFDPGPPPRVDDYLDDVEKFVFGNISLKLISTPGHTPGSVSFYDQNNSTLFVGDVIFAEGGVGRTDFSYCSRSDLISSIDKIFTLPDQTHTYCGHGNSFYLSDEKVAHGKNLT